MIDFEALFSITYGMYIVSAGEGKEGSGFICNSVFQVTAEPPQIAVCCNKDNYTAQLIKQSNAFSISVLQQDTSSKLIGAFGYKSGRDINKLEGKDFSIGETGVPVVKNDAIASIECKLKNTSEAGTHLIFIGEVLNSEFFSDLPPLTYEHYRKVKKGISPKNAPTYIDKSKLTENKTESKKYKCVICGHIYDPDAGDPENNIAPGTSFKDLPEDWVCPLCGASKEDFIEI